jgi:toxin-antitoxin system PIN domain toxin
VIAVDTNILVYAYDAAAPLHDRARAAVERLLREPAWGLPWIVAGEFYAFLTSPRRWREPKSEDAVAALDSLISAPGVHLLTEPPGHWPLLKELLTAAQPRGSDIHDARVAAVCIAGGVTEFWTSDRDFSWYPQLRVRNPLVG